MVARVGSGRGLQSSLRNAGMKQIARDTKDIVGKTVKRTLLSNGLELQRVTVPIGLLLVIFEARPDCLPQVSVCSYPGLKYQRSFDNNYGLISQISALSIASANGLVLKGGKEAVNTNSTLMSIVSEALLTHGVQSAIQMVNFISESNL